MNASAAVGHCSEHLPFQSRSPTFGEQHHGNILFGALPPKETPPRSKLVSLDPPKPFRARLCNTATSNPIVAPATEGDDPLVHFFTSNL